MQASPKYSGSVSLSAYGEIIGKHQRTVISWIEMVLKSCWCEDRNYPTSCFIDQNPEIFDIHPPSVSSANEHTVWHLDWLLSMQSSSLRKHTQCSTLDTACSVQGEQLWSRHRYAVPPNSLHISAVSSEYCHDTPVTHSVYITVLCA